ncbi:hypothetical protein BRADI_4g03990v3 [Brachypodium distachyon]|uniref:Uncharacterized protein n=1 Tax=Brachypodium distachyon TaxID=15368 RepID=I1IHA1_BRADI|nr:hypothetical protein BRADI_4g03990v3 [Brachypodium distachyon]PNT62476.1 hypothetical protein BRADI_4g03990v3 [Brachypodium distachyon]
MQGNRLQILVGLAALLLAAFATPASSAAVVGSYDSSGRAVISHAAARANTAAAVAGALMRRRVEDSVAPEPMMGSHLLLGKGVSESALDKNHQACTGPCPAAGGPYTRPCTYKERCPP